MHPTELITTLLQSFDAAKLEELSGASARFRREELDLSSLATSQVGRNLRGWGVVVPAFGQPTGAWLEGVMDGVVVQLRPGAIVRTPFQRLELRNLSGVSAGAFVLYVLTHPSTVLELGDSESGASDYDTYQATDNVTTNLPAADTDGVSLANSKGVRAIVKAQTANTIVSGLGVWWLLDPAVGTWAESGIQVDLARTTPREAVACPDEFTTVGRGRAFLELRSVVTTGGANLNVHLFAN